MHTRDLTIFCLTALIASPGHADDRGLRERLEEHIPGLSVDALEESAIPGLYEFVIGSRVFYLSADGRYLIQGELVDLDAGRNLTEMRRARLRATMLEGVPEADMVIFEPDAESRYTITVFTDIDCGYCRKLHAEIEALQGSGVRVRYLLYPRSGLDTESAKKAEAVWCSEDRNDALTRAKAGRRVAAKPCGETPVGSNLELARRIGVTGTPAIFTGNGDMIRGYLPHGRLLEELDRLQAQHED